MTANIYDHSSDFCNCYLKKKSLWVRVEKCWNYVTGKTNQTSIPPAKDCSQQTSQQTWFNRHQSSPVSINTELQDM